MSRTSSVMSYFQSLFSSFSSTSNPPPLRRQASFRALVTEEIPEDALQLHQAILFAGQSHAERSDALSSALTACLEENNPIVEEALSEEGGDSETANLIPATIAAIDETPSAKELKKQIALYREQENEDEAKNKKALLLAFAAWEKTLSEKDKAEDDFKILRRIINCLKLEESFLAKYSAIGKTLPELERIQAQKTATSVVAQSSQAQRLRDAIKEVERQGQQKNARLHKLIYGGVILAVVTVSLVTFFTLPFSTFLLTAMPWTVLIGVVIAALNYSKRSFNTKVTAGRGVAVLIALATAVLALTSMLSAHLPLSVALLFGTGCFVANLVLYRANVPLVMDSLFSYLKDLRKSFRIQDLVTPAAAKKLILIIAALITGAVLTAGMWFAWPAAMTGAFTLLAAPYFFYPLMAVALIANTSFVYRGLSRAYDVLIQARKAYRHGLVVLTNEKTKQDQYCVAPENTDAKLIEHKGLTAVTIYFFGILPTDSNWTAVGRVALHLVIKLGLVVLIAILSQKALIGVNLELFHKLVPGLQEILWTAINIIGSIVGVTSRISFVILDLFTNLNKLIQAVKSPDVRKQFKENIQNFFKSDTWRQSYSELVQSQTQNEHMLDIWRATGKKDWKAIWKQQYEQDWKYRTPSYKKAYYYVKAAVIIVLRLFIPISILFNTVANAYVSIYNGNPQAKGLEVPPVKAVAGGVSSFALNAFSAESLARTREKKLSPTVTEESMHAECIAVKADNQAHSAKAEAEALRITAPAGGEAIAAKNFVSPRSGTTTPKPKTNAAKLRTPAPTPAASASQDLYPVTPAVSEKARGRLGSRGTPAFGARLFRNRALGGIPAASSLAAPPSARPGIGSVKV